ncbi:RseA family anti-sigma factor [Ferrimonas gelatinilytica]|uniref:Anti-sigma-E factor RseA n=2 Tax=Ferrimonas gelatinilytica TaxID=1255257 RepID=A0ABP9S8X6_9GAMM
MVDGQTHDSVLDQISGDPEMMAQWHRYHLIGDAMRGELPQQIQLDIADRVAAALEQEPAILAPKVAKRRFSVPANAIAWGQKMGQYAIAAGVAAIAVVGVQQYGGEGAQDGSPLSVLQTTPILGAPTPVSYSVPGMGAEISQEQRLSEQEAQEQQQRANAFLRDHLLQQRINGIVLESASASGK